MKIVKVKKDKYGILMIPSKVLFRYPTGEEVKSLNNVWLEDGTTVLVGDDEIEVDNDRTTEFNKEDK